MHPHQLKLLINNKGKGFFKSEANQTGEATIYLYDVIVNDDWLGGITPLTFAKELVAITDPIIHLRLNSPGGDVFAARAMQTAMNEHASKIIVHIDGIAASAATFLVNQADESIISKGGMLMIHNAWSIAMGNAKDFTDMANLLNKIDDSIVTDYVAKTGKSKQQIIDWMSNETYFSDQESVDFGFVDKIAESSPKNKIDWDLSAYKKLPLNSEIDEKTEKLEKNSDPVDDPIIENHTKNRPKYREMMTA